MKKVFLTILISLVCLGLVCAGVVCGCRFGVDATDRTVYYQSQLADTRVYDAIVVPGAATVSTRPGAHLQDRLDTAVTLYQNGAADTILCTGYVSDESGFYEANVMYAYLLEAGIPAEAIVRDYYGEDTAESLRRARDAGYTDIIVCTQGMYAARTAYLAQRFGLNCEIAESDIVIYTVGVGRGQLREFFAAVKAVWEGAICKNATYSLDLYPLQ